MSTLHPVHSSLTLAQAGAIADDGRILAMGFHHVGEARTFKGVVLHPIRETPPAPIPPQMQGHWSGTPAFGSPRTRAFRVWPPWGAPRPGLGF